MGLRNRTKSSGARIRIETAENLLEDLRPLLRALGALAVEESQDSFRKQAWAGRAWKPRYPGRPGPKVNVGGLLADVSTGSFPKSRRFQDRPALIDKGELRASIADRIVGPAEVEIGSALPYADIQQQGGISKQVVTPTARKTLARWLRSLSKSRRREISKKVGFLFAFERLDTKVVGRQFVGTHAELDKRFAQLVEIYFEEGGRPT